MSSDVSKEQKGSPARSPSNRITDPDQLKQYGTALGNNLYNLGGYSNSIIQAMYGYKQGGTIQRQEYPLNAPAAPAKKENKTGLPRVSVHQSSNVHPLVIQREWIGEDYPKTWDVAIDGVQWYKDAEGNLWYKVLNLGHDHIFRKFEGEENKRTHKAWEKLETRLGIRSKAEARIKAFDIHNVESQNKDEIKEYRKNKNVSNIGGEAPTPVLHNDKQGPVSKTNWKWVADDLGKLKGDKEQTKFVNMFHLPQEKGPVDAVVMMENFREKAKPFFASDAFFHQWMRVKDISSLSDLPRTFPRFLYRNNISNKILGEKLLEILGNKEFVDVDLGSEVFGQLEITDNVKSTNNILKEYNNINAIRGEAPSKIVAMRIFKGPGIRFEIGKE